MAYMLTACIGMAYIGIAYITMAFYSYGLHPHVAIEAGPDA